jgi:hypothetical protein
LAQTEEAMPLDRERLEAMNINGLDLVLMLMNLTIETIAAISPDGEMVDQRLTQIANHLDDFSRKLTEPRMKLLVQQLARGLIATERTS